MINYYLLTKPGIILGNLVTFIAAFILGSRGNIEPWLFIYTLLGLSLVMASGCVYNNILDLNVDSKMDRTKNRPLVLGHISTKNAFVFATALGISGLLILSLWTNILAVGTAMIGLFVYVILYSLWKCKTVYGTAIGSIAGAIPPVVGYCAASSQFDLAAMILFLIMVFWQMPHFFSIALLHLDDYTKAGIPVLPVSKGIWRTKIHTVLYIMLFIPLTMMLTLFGYTGLLFFIVTGIVGTAWLLLSIRGFECKNTRKWGQQMFLFSLVTIAAICFIIPLDLRFHRDEIQKIFHNG